MHVNRKWRRLAACPAVVILITGGAISAQGPALAAAAGCVGSANGSWSDICNVQEGDVSHLVEAIQVYTTSQENCAPDTFVDGTFGSGTKAAVICLQNDLSIPADGIVGPQTWTAMQKGLTRLSNHGGFTYYTSLPCGCGGGNYRRTDDTGNWWTDANLTWVHMDSNPPS